MSGTTLRAKARRPNAPGKDLNRRQSAGQSKLPESVDARMEPASGGLGILARKTKSLRAAAGMTLQALSAASGVSQSALSKIENGQLSPTYEKILALAKGLGVDVAELFNDSTAGTPMGRRTVTLKGRGVLHHSAQYDYEILCSELSGKQFLPLLATVKAHGVQEFSALPKHDGEEFVYVVRGDITLHTEFYEPIRLCEGDCCYFDSGMRHGLVSAGRQDAVVLWICSKNVSLPSRQGA